MDFSKLKNKLLIILCVFVVLFPFWCVRGLCSEIEEVEYNIVTGINITPNSNVFNAISSTTSGVGYVSLEQGYIYYFTNNNSTTSRSIAVSSDIPEVNGTYTYLGLLDGNDTFTYRADNSNTYLYFGFNANSQNTFKVTRQKIESMDGVVNDLVQNVGIQSLWNTFNDANPFLLVVVLFSFGLFIIVVLVRKLRKGKGGF